jgi:branched-subunit amino acid aminotransferase/4-amino-4-deoxychorismate lyase
MAVPFDERSDLIWFDGKLIPTAESKISVLTHGLHYASCVFEGERAYGGIIFEGTKHSERLKRSAQILDFEIPYSVAEIDAAKQLVLEKIRKKLMSGQSRGAARSSSASRRRTTKSISPSQPGNGRAISIRRSASKASGSISPNITGPIRRRRRASPKRPAFT